MDTSAPWVFKLTCLNRSGPKQWQLPPILLSNSFIDGILYELWHEKILDSKELELLKPFGCLVKAHIPEQRRKPLNKIDARLTFALPSFIGYYTFISHKIWDRKRMFLSIHKS